MKKLLLLAITLSTFVLPSCAINGRSISFGISPDALQQLQNAGSTIIYLQFHPAGTPYDNSNQRVPITIDQVAQTATFTKIETGQTITFNYACVNDPTCSTLDPGWFAFAYEASYNPNTFDVPGACHTTANDPALPPYMYIGADNQGYADVTCQ